MTIVSLQGSIELGMIYAIMSLGVFISFRTLNMPDLTVDSSFTLGAAVSAVMCSAGHSCIGILLSFLAGFLAGCITALLDTKLKIQPLLAGILMMLSLYSINLRAMGGKANISLLYKPTIFNLPGGAFVQNNGSWIVSLTILLIVYMFLLLFLRTEFGLSLRATGDNDRMVRALGGNTDFTILIGLASSNGLVAASGGMIAQFQSFADISMGVGMTVIGLASVVIGEVVFGTRPLSRRLAAVILGSILYRSIVALALDSGMPPTDLKLISAVIVAAALSSTTARDRIGLLKRRIRAVSAKKEAGHNA